MAPLCSFHPSSLLFPEENPTPSVISMGKKTDSLKWIHRVIRSGKLDRKNTTVTAQGHHAT